MPPYKQSKRLVNFELIGLPGSGKTTLAIHLANRNGISVFFMQDKKVKGRKIRGRIKAFHAAPIFSLLLYAAMLFRRKASQNNFRRLFSVQKKYIATKTLTNRSFINIIDEGPVHTVFSAFWGTKHSKISDFFLKATLRQCIDNDQCFILVEKTAIKCLESIAQRTFSVSRFHSKTCSSKLKEFGKDKTYEHIVKTLESIGAKIIRVDLSQND